MAKDCLNPAPPAAAAKAGCPKGLRVSAWTKAAGFPIVKRLPIEILQGVRHFVQNLTVKRNPSEEIHIIGRPPRSHGWLCTAEGGRKPRPTSREPARALRCGLARLSKCGRASPNHILHQRRADTTQ